MIRTLVAAVTVAAMVFAGNSPVLGSSAGSALGSSAGSALGSSAGSVAFGGPASAVQAGATTRRFAAPRARLTIAYTAEAGYAAAVKLTCGPAGGGHPRAKQACATLRKAGANPDRITPAPVMCMMLYAPVTAQITGIWHGTRVRWSHTYGNRCEMTRATGVLFEF